jgi:two-component system NtrC family sensor kinase
MAFQSLRLKFMLIFFTFFLIPYGLLTFFSISISKQMMRKSTIDHLQNLVEVKETAIEQWLKERVRDGKTIAESLEIKSLDPKRIEPFLSLIKHFERAYLDISVLNLKGQIISGGGKPLKTSFEKEEWFQGALREDAFISIPAPALEAQSPQPTITIAVAIKDAEGHPIGVLRELVVLTYIYELISESKLGETGKFFIVHPQGQFVLHSRLIELLREGTAKVSYFGKIPPGETYTGVYRDYAGNEVLGSWKWIPGLRCYLIAERETQEAFLEINLLVKNATIIFIVSTIFILRISYWVIGNATTPIKRLSEAVALFATGHFGKVVSTKRGDEIGRLVVGFNVMAEKLKKAYADLEGKIEASNKELEIAYHTLIQRQEQLIQSGKMAALGQLSAGIAHEIRNPLTSIKIFIQSLEKESGLEENQKEDFRIILKEIDRINEHITLFLNFARPEEPLFQAININELVREPLNLLTAKLKNSDIQPMLSLADDHPPVEGDRKQLAQVLLNLMLNAVEAMPQGGTLTICSTVTVNPESRQEFLQLIIKDTGHGIPEKDRPYLFDPFFTTKAGGTGLGLSIAYSIVQKHHGRIEVESELGKGSSFILSLPIQKERSWKEYSL